MYRAIVNICILLSFYLACKGVAAAASSTPASNVEQRSIDQIPHHYTCGKDGVSGRNISEQKPQIHMSCGGQIRYVDDHVEFMCKVTANPPAQITWFVDGMDLSQDHKVDYLSCKQRLKIHPVLLHHSGLYRCVARNRYGAVNKTCQLTVKATPSCPLINRGIVLSGASGDKAIIGYNVTMSCTVLYAKFIYWKKNGTVLPKSVSRGQMSSLVLTNITKDDSANYTCVGFKVSQVEVSSYKYLKVVDPPKVDFPQRRSNANLISPGWTIFIGVWLCVAGQTR